MNKSMIFGIMLILMVIYGCKPISQAAAFEQGVKRISEIDNKYGAGMKTVPNSTEGINELLAELTGFAALNENMPQSIKYLLGFRIKSLEAEKLHIEGWQWGRASTTEWGFGCKKGSAKILASAGIRNASAQKGYEALESLQLFIEQFQTEAKSVNLSQKDVLFLNAAYRQVEDKARKDAGIIRQFCKNQTEEIVISI